MLTLIPLTLSLMAPFVEREIAFKTQDGLELRGTYLGPSPEISEGDYKALLLLPGSGPTDRDGNQPGFTTDLLKQIASGLSAQGVATFRFDKRAARSNASHWPKDPAKLDEFFSYRHHLADAEAALETLRAQKGIDKRQVGVLGHSEGGLIALSLAAKLGEKRVSRLALLSTGGRPLDKVLEDQIKSILSRQTQDEKVREQYLANLRDSIAEVERTGSRPKGVLPGLASLFSPGTGVYFKEILPIDPLPLLGSYSGSVLIVQGGTDHQVSPESDYPALKRAAEGRKKGRTASLLVPSVSHNLKPVADPAGAGVTGPMSVQALKEIVRWAIDAS